MKQILLTMMLAWGALAATNYNGLQYDAGTTTPSGCQVPAFFVNTGGTPTLYVCNPTNQSGPSGVFVQAGSSGGATTTHIAFRALCQNTISGTNFDVAGTVGTAAATTTCDNSGADGAVGFVSGSTTHIQFHIFLPSTWTDPVKFQIAQADTSATSGTAKFGIAVQCAGHGTAYSSGGYGAYTTFANLTAGTAYIPLQSNTISMTTGCTAGQTLYGDLELTSGNNTTSATVNVNWLDAIVTW